MRGVLRWSVRQPRVWVSLAAVVVAYATSGNGPGGWSAFVVTTTGVLAALSIRAKYVADHPERAARAAAKHQAEVDAILWQYERDRAARDRSAERR
ncbi:MAG TPA: hypothetical protein VNQ77_09980 [Frankiaceae bacterium]|nr:hypothetical protein [Frankiaceae bacterium]